MTDQEAIEHLKRCKRFLESSTSDVLDEVPDAIDIAIRAIDNANLVRSKHIGLLARMAGNIASGMSQNVAGYTGPLTEEKLNDIFEALAKNSVAIARAILTELASPNPSTTL
jgi:hypothetical protein